MPSKNSRSSPTPPPPPPELGTMIDNNSLELVEVLGIGGYGVVYRAVSNDPLRKSFAVKCLVNSRIQNGTRQRQLHIREITLHKLASGHPNVVTLHRVIEEYHYTYIIMEYASDGDLFSQILNNSRYLGNDNLIKHIFLQLLDAVEYCHDLGIYHRDLKPENVLCFDGGLRIAITDFGLATTDRFSDEFRTGSIYHMSPECQGGVFAPTGSYSPLFNDIWSLAIILLNLSTGRNPWKSAASSDPTFQAYLQDPVIFLPTVLPISPELNAILVRMLEVDWQRRMTLEEVRSAIQTVDRFYSEGVVFEGSMARCPWEVGVEIESDSNASTKGEHVDGYAEDDLRSYWSNDSESDMHFASQSATEDASLEDFSSCDINWGFGLGPTWSCSPAEIDCMKLYDPPRTPPCTYSPLSPSASGSLPSGPATPNGPNASHDQSPIKALKIDTGCLRIHYCTAQTSFSTVSSTMHTAAESHKTFSSSFFLASSNHGSEAAVSLNSHNMPSSDDMRIFSTPESKGLESTWDYSEIDFASFPPVSNHGSLLGLDMNSRNEDENFPSPVSTWQPHPVTSFVPTFFLPSIIPTSVHGVASSSPRKSNEGKSKGSIFFKFAFPRSSRSPRPSSRSLNGSLSGSASGFESDNVSSVRSGTTHVSSPLRESSPWRATVPPIPIPQKTCHQEARIRSKRQWFRPGKFFTVAGAS